MDAPVAPPPEAYRPPAPTRHSEAIVLAKAVFTRRRDLLSLMPAEAYRVKMAKVPVGRRRIWIVNDPDTIRAVLVDKVDNYPKSDLMVSALRPLVGDGIFISNGPTWRRQRTMIEPAFAHMRLTGAFPQMLGAVDTLIAEIAAAGGPVEIDAAMSRVTADVIYRTIFSEPLESEDARGVFDAFQRYQDVVPQVKPTTILTTAANAVFKDSAEVVEACRTIRAVLGRVVDRRLAEGGAGDDLAGAIIAARDKETGTAFSREELIDQIAVFFLAGHETSASVLAWALFILSQAPAAAERIRAEVADVIGDGPFTYASVGRLAFTRAVFKETMRLYPPVSFITRIAREADTLREHEIRASDLVVVSPWLVHRHDKFWDEPEAFRPERFLPENEKKIRANTYLPFGLGPRVCTGGGFAQLEGVLILAALTRRFRFETLQPEKVAPICRMTVRPEAAIRARAVDLAA
jgi:cytochrome P450